MTNKVLYTLQVKSVAGKPNVDAMTQAELVDILNRNSARERDER